MNAYICVSIYVGSAIESIYIYIYMYVYVCVCVCVCVCERIIFTKLCLASRVVK